MSEKVLLLFLADEAATVTAGKQIGHCLQAGMVVFMEGTLGAGKTTMTRGLLQAFGYSGAVKSPTYTLVEPYEQLSPPTYHFDLYRLGDAEELEYMGIRDYFSEQSLCIVEWAERGAGYLPKPDLTLKLCPQTCDQTGVVGRQLELMMHTELSQQTIVSLESDWVA